MPFGAALVIDDPLCCAGPGEFCALAARPSGSESKHTRKRCGKIQEVVLLQALAASEAVRAGWVHGFNAKTAQSTENSRAALKRTRPARCG